jgi:hypothetical protein
MVNTANPDINASANEMLAFAARWSATFSNPARTNSNRRSADNDLMICQFPFEKLSLSQLPFTYADYSSDAANFKSAAKPGIAEPKILPTVFVACQATR